MTIISTITERSNKMGKEADEYYLYTKDMATTWRELEESLLQSRNGKLTKKDFDTLDLADEFYLKTTIFGSSREEKALIDLLKTLHRRKYLLKLAFKSELFIRNKPFVIEFTGTPRTGKTTCINALKDFFKKAGFKVKVIEELTTSAYYKNTMSKLRSNFSLENWNLLILSETYKTLHIAMQEDVDIILVDRGINDRQIWNHCRYISGDMSAEVMQENQDLYQLISKSMVDVLVELYVDPLISVRRDYHTSISLEPRRFNKIENIQAFNQSMQMLRGYHMSAVNNFLMIDTETLSAYETALMVTGRVLDYMLDTILSTVVY